MLARGIRKLREERERRRKEQEKKKRQKDRQKKRIHRFGQVELKYAKRGSESCLLAVLATFFIIIIFSVSYINKGNVSVLFGILGFVIVVVAVDGLKKGLAGLKERNKNYTFCRVGIGWNGLILVLLLATFIRGFF